MSPPYSMVTRYTKHRRNVRQIVNQLQRFLSPKFQFLLKFRLIVNQGDKNVKGKNRGIRQLKRIRLCLEIFAGLLHILCHI